MVLELALELMDQVQSWPENGQGGIEGTRFGLMRIPINLTSRSSLVNALARA
jgi:hypothetical protein